MATVYHVVDRNLLRHSAMKVLAPELARQESYRLRFLEEAQISGQLDHPNIVPVHELGTDDDGKPIKVPPGGGGPPDPVPTIPSP